LKASIKEKILLLVFLCFIYSSPVHAGLPEVSQVMVTDVTPVSFSVVWASSEPSTSTLKIFEDEAGTTVLDNVNLESQPTRNGSAIIAQGAEDNGVIKIRISGLSPGTAYYYQTVTISKSGGEITTYPDSPPMPSVTTESGYSRTMEVEGSEIPFTNDLVVFDCYHQDGTTPADGTLLVVEVDGGHYPLSGFVGDGVPSPQATIDLNNLFGEQSRKNSVLGGGEQLTLTRFMGIHGTESVVLFVPQNEHLGEMRYPAGPGLIHAVRILQTLAGIVLEDVYDLDGDEEAGLGDVIYVLQWAAGLR
jgi:hypothetical protein